MPTSSPQLKDASPLSAPTHVEDMGPLKFISELGRSLLFTVHPKKAAACVTESVRQGVDARLCVFVAELESIGLISSAFGGDGEIEDAVLRRGRFEKWLHFMPPQIGYTEREPDEFLAGGDHTVEYVSPLHIDGEIKGALVVCFGDEGEITEHVTRIIDAATQMAAMSVNLSAHYETALNDSLHEAREE